MSPQDDEDRWRRRFQLFALVRLTGVALVLVGLAIGLGNLIRPGGVPLLGGVFVAAGLAEAMVVPRLLRRRWGREDE